MVIEYHQTSWAFGKDIHTKLNPGEERILGGSSVHVHTPNLLTVQEGDREAFHLRDAINDIESVGHGLGGRDSVTWSQGSHAEDVSYAAIEKQLLRHPLVGHELALYYGTREDGIHQNLLDEQSGFRVEQYQRRRRVRFVTTDAAWTKVSVVDGHRRNIYPGSDQRPVEIKVKILEGKYAGREEIVKDDSLRVSVPDERAKQVLQEVTSRIRRSGINESDRQALEGFGLTDILYWLLIHEIVTDRSYDPSCIVPSDNVAHIIETAAASGMDTSQPLDIAVRSGVDLSNPDLGSIIGSGGESGASDPVIFDSSPDTYTDTGGYDSGSFDGGGMGGE